MSKMKKLGKALIAAGAAYGASKMFGNKGDDPMMKMMGGAKTGDANIAENIAIFDRGMEKIAKAGGVSKLKSGGMSVMARGCKLGKKRPTKIT